MTYKVSTYYDSDTEAGFRFDDPDVAIDWSEPVEKLQPSARDRAAPTLTQLAQDLPFRYTPSR